MKHKPFLSKIPNDCRALRGRNQNETLGRAKRKGVGGRNFCPPVVPQSGTGDGKRFCNSALAEYQNRKIFISLVEKFLYGSD